MCTTGNIQAWIFVKSDSITFAERNNLLLKGKPLIAYTIEVAHKSRYIKDVFISTDSPDIAAVAEQYGAIVPFLRSKDLSNNSVPVQKAWQHAVEWNRSQKEYPVMDIMVSLPMLVPLRTSEDIDNSIELYLQGECDMVTAVSPSNRHPAYDMVFRDEAGNLSLILNNDNPFARTRETVVYDLTNMIYVCNADFAANESNFLRARTKAIVVPRERSFDIRTMLDLKMAEYILDEGI